LENLSRAVSGGYTVGQREIIEPHHHMVKKADQHDAWDLSIWKSTYDSTTTFFNNPNTVFNFTNLF